LEQPLGKKRSFRDESFVLLSKRNPGFARKMPARADHEEHALRGGDRRCFLRKLFSDGESLSVKELHQKSDQFGRGQKPPGQIGHAHSCAVITGQRETRA
jgi:hypothetical protein